MATNPVRRKSLETKLFERFSDDDILKAAEKVLKGEIVNIPQLNFIKELLDKKINKEQREGHVNIDYMSLIDVGRAALEDDGFIETLTKATEKKRRKIAGDAIDTRKNYDQMREAVDSVAQFRGITKKDVISQTHHFLSGGFDKELEGVEAVAEEETDDYSDVSE